jgi:hypothetical protein
MIGLDTISVQQRLKLKELDECKYWDYFEIETNIEVWQSQMKIQQSSLWTQLIY